MQMRLLVAAVWLACLGGSSAGAQVGQTVIIPDTNADPQTGKSAKRFQVLRAKPDTDKSVITELKAGQLDQPPYFLLELSRRLLPVDKAEATEYWLLARIRMIYDVQRCADRSAAADFNMRFFGTPETRTIVEDRQALEAAKARIRLRADLFDGRADPWWACLHGMQAITAGLGGTSLPRSAYLKPESEWAAIREKLVASLAPDPAAATAPPR
jgi:hypothetical protein